MNRRHSADQEWIIGSYKIISDLGVGEPTPAFVAVHTVLNEKVMLKQIPRNDVDPITPDLVRHHINQQQPIIHQNLTELFDAFDTPDSFYLVQEYGANGTLTLQLTTNPVVSEDTARVWFREMLMAIGHLHVVHELFHGDVRPDNVFFDDHMHIRIANAGLQELYPITAHTIGPPVFRAPEVLAGGEVTEAADIWGLGVILYLMVAGKLPWSGLPLVKVIDQICRSPFPVLPQASPLLVDLISLMLEKDPEQRGTALDILDHPWFAEGETGRPFDDRDSRFESQIKDESIDVVLVQELALQSGVPPQQLKESLMLKKVDAHTTMCRIKRRPKALAALWPLNQADGVPQSRSMFSQPRALQKGILEQTGWRTRVRKDLMRSTSIHIGPKVLQPSLRSGA